MGETKTAQPFSLGGLRRLRQGLGNGGIDKDTTLRLLATLELHREIGRAEERERCVKICDGFASGHHFAGDMAGEASFRRCIVAIRVTP